MSIAKVLLNNESVIDLTADTVDVETLHEDITALIADGSSIEGEIDPNSFENDIIQKTLTSYSDEELTTVIPYMFYGQTKLININLPNVTSIGQYAFYNCSGLTNISFPNVTSIGASAFYNCFGITNISFPNVTVMSGRDAFCNCSNLKNVFFPKVTTATAAYLFYGVGSGGSAVLPKVTSLLQTFRMSKFKNIDLGNVTTIGDYTFNNSVFTVLILRKTAAITTLGSTGAFATTPFASGGAGGTLYVPESLITSYESATNWSTLLGYENNQIKSIESTHTDPDAFIDLTLYYADGTPIPQEE